MNHRFAIESEAAERYVLGEMNDFERDAYEEHFFGCATCAHEVKLADQFLRTARQAAPANPKSRVHPARMPGLLSGLLCRIRLFWSNRAVRRTMTRPK